MNGTDCLQSCRQRGFSLIPLKPRSKVPLVKWKDYQLSDEDFLRFLGQDVNWAIRCDENFHALDFDDTETYSRFVKENGQILENAPTVRTSRGYHVWFKPQKPVSSFKSDGIEVKGLGSLVVVPPSIHPSGVVYHFEKPMNGRFPEMDIEELLDVSVVTPANNERPSTAGVPSDFALRYGKSPYPQSLCGRATKVFSRSDGGFKHLISLRCWKWHCPKCAPLLKRYWLGKLEEVSFRFILRLPTMIKPTAFLRRVGKPGYIHIVANGESWLFLAGGDNDKVWLEARQAGYQLVAGDISGDSSLEEVKECLEQALCREEEPLNTRRKISHSRRLFTKISRENDDNESKQYCKNKEGEDMCAASSEKPPTWNSEVMMKPIHEVVKELEAQGWRVLWQSEVEAIAIKDDRTGCHDTDIVELMENLGIKLKKVGNEYTGLCPFHSDHNPSLSVNREKRLWHCFGCGKGGGIHRFIQEWQSRDTRQGYE